MAVFIIMVAFVFVIVLAANAKSKQSSNTTNRPENKYPLNPWQTDQKRTYNASNNVNTNSMFDSHLCNDDQHGDEKTSYGYSTSNYNIKGASFSKQEKEKEIEELKDLLAAGIISHEEYSQRRREL